jgi:hypothetical protein
MLDASDQANVVIRFLKKHGFCPRKVANNPMGAALMQTWVMDASTTDESVLNGLRNLEILGGKSLGLDRPSDLRDPQVVPAAWLEEDKDRC